MFLRCKKRRKDGKEHLYWSVVDNRRISEMGSGKWGQSRKWGQGTISEFAAAASFVLIGSCLGKNRRRLWVAERSGDKRFSTGTKTHRTIQQKIMREIQAWMKRVEKESHKSEIVP